MVNVIDDAQAKEILAGLEHPRITLEYMESRIKHEEFINPDSAPTLTICLITLDNGFYSIGMSAPASNQNFNLDLGRKYARENAIRDLWGKFGFALTEKIYASKYGQPLQGIEVPANPFIGNAKDAGAANPPTPTAPASTLDLTKKV